jgi:prophage antirepressor-like protein
MSISTLFVQIYDNLIKLNDNDIIILFDKSKNIWLSLSHLLKALGYNSYRDEMKSINKIVSNEDISTYADIIKDNQKNKIKQKNIQPHMKMISEGGLYLLLDKSHKPLAIELKKQLYTQVLPSIRKSGQYKINRNDNKIIKKLTEKLQLKSKEQSIRNSTKKQYNNLSDKGFIYILKVKTIQDGKEKQCYKIGYTTNLNKRLATYKTGNPDIELAYQENVNCNKKQLEKCVLNLNILKRIGSKKEVICDSPLEEIKKEIEDCKKLISRYSSNIG